MNLGIDFGNTVSRAAFQNEQGIPEVLPDFEDSAARDTPSVVHIGKRGCLIGGALERLLENDPRLAVARDFQRDLANPEPVYTDEDGRPYLATELASLVLRKLAQDAEKASSGAVETVTLAISSRFGAEERRALLEAAALGGLAQLELVDSAVAVARHYGVEASSRPPRHHLAYDLGGSSFKASVLSAGPEGIQHLASVHLNLGAREFDGQIAELARDSFRFAHGFDPMDELLPAVQLRHLAEQAKLHLAHGDRECFRRTTLIGGKPLDFYLNRRQLDRLVAPLLLETVAACQRCLDQAGIGWSQLESVLLSGASCRLRAVGRTLIETSGLAPERIRLRLPEFAVAFGAARSTRGEQTARPRDLTLRRQSTAVMDRDLVIQTLVPGTRECRRQVVIRQGSPLPAQREFRCLTGKDGQKRLEFHWALCTGLGPESGANAADELGRSVVDDLPGGAKGYPVDVSVTVNLDGSIHITTLDPKLGVRSSHTLQDPKRQSKATRERQRDWLQNLPINPA